MLFARRKFDDQPTEPVGVVLATTGGKISQRALDRAVTEAGGRPITILALLRIYGSQFGLPNPGLLPTKDERDRAYDVLNNAIEAFEAKGIVVDGQIAMTRSLAKMICKVAKVRGASVVVMDDSPSSGWKRKAEGDVAAIVQRRLPEGVELVLIGGAKGS
jgi:nucleotide-binding universal stress UspA family protein